MNHLDVLEIWPGGIGPGSEGLSITPTITENSKIAFFPERSLTGITRPNLTAFVPDTPNRTAVIIAPGGGYGRISTALHKRNSGPLPVVDLPVSASSSCSAR